MVDGDVSGVPGVGVPNCEDDRGGDEHSEESVEDAIEGIDERVCGSGNPVPVQGREGVETKTAKSASNCSQVNVIRGNPGHPAEVGHGLDDIAGEPGVDEHSTKTVHEPPHPRYSPAINDSVGFSVEGLL
jgi:hypothetical protein